MTLTLRLSVIREECHAACERDALRNGLAELREEVSNANERADNFAAKSQEDELWLSTLRTQLAAAEKSAEDWKSRYHFEHINGNTLAVILTQLEAELSALKSSLATAEKERDEAKEALAKWTKEYATKGTLANIYISERNAALAALENIISYCEGDIICNITDIRHILLIGRSALDPKGAE